MRRRMTAVLLALVLGCLPAPALAGPDPIGDLEDLINESPGEALPEAPDDWEWLDSLFPVPSVAEVELEVALLDQTGALGDQAALAVYIRQAAARARANPGDAAELTRLALAYQLQGNWSQAQAHLLQAIRLDPESSGLYRYLATAVAQADPRIHVLVSGVPVAFDVAPVVVNGRTLVPVRYVVDRLGGQTGYDAATRTVTVTVTLGSRRLELTLDRATALVDGRPVQLDVPATAIDGRTLVPLRFVSENLRARVGYYPGGGGAAVISINP